MQTRTDFEQAAQKIADQFVASKGASTINKIATDLAKTAGLNPDGVRNMVRMANVATFTKIFSAETGPDRMIEFEVGDPEVVINNLFSGAQESVKQASDNTYSRTKDYYGDFPKTIEKIAYEAPPALVEPGPKVSKRYLVHIMKEAGETLRQEKAQLEYRWLDNMEKAAHILQLVCENKDTEISRCEREALAKLGQDTLPELKILHYMTTKERDGFLYDQEKVASVVEHELAIDNSKFKNVFTFLKTASDIRKELSNLSPKKEWLAEQLAKVEG